MATEYYTISKTNIQEFNEKLNMLHFEGFAPIHYSTSTLVNEFKNTDKINIWAEKEIITIHSCILVKKT